MSQLLSLQQKQQLPSEVTAEDMIELLVEQSKHSLSEVSLWHTYTTLDFNSVCNDGEIKVVKLILSVCLKALGVWSGELCWSWHQTLSQACKTTIIRICHIKLDFFHAHILFSVCLSLPVSGVGGERQNEDEGCWVWSQNTAELSLSELYLTDISNQLKYRCCDVSV